MKKLIFALAILFAAGTVLASCPVWKPYNCVMMPNGKMLCGCGI